MSSPSNRDVLPAHTELFYGGTWRKPDSGSHIPVYNPANGEQLTSVAIAGQSDVDAAVAAAHKGQKEWQALAPMARGKVLRQMAQRVRDHAENLALLDSLDCGNPYKGMLFDMELGATLLDYFGGLVTELKGETLPMPDGVINYVAREPLGVVARIIAFNHPAMFFCAKIGAPLGAGNSVIVKPSEHTPLSALYLADLFSDLLPAGVLSVLNGAAETGGIIASHDKIQNVSVVGSIPTGKAVLAAASRTVKSSLMELGGKNPMLIYPDAHLEKAAASAVHGMNFGWTGGQSCGSTSRIFVHDSVYQQVAEDIANRVASIKVGLPQFPETEMGCLSSTQQYEKTREYIQVGLDEGATLLAGGGPPKGSEFEKGNFVSPTVFGDVTTDMRLAREEIFGPVLSILRWHDEESVIESVNALPYGLTASIWTSDLKTAHQAAARVHAGYVWINNSSSHFLGAPFGGYKQSGLGREECLAEMLHFTQTKNINVMLEP